MGSDLSTDLSTDLATDLSTNLAGAAGSSDWLTTTGWSLRLEQDGDYSTIATTGSDIDTWTDEVGTVFTPSAGQADYPGGVTANGHNGVDFVLANNDRFTASLGIASSETYAAFFVIRPDALSATQVLMYWIDSGTTNQIGWRFEATGKLRHYRNALGVNHESTNTISAATVSRVMYCYDGTNSILRVEGAAEESSALAIGSHDAGTCVLGAFPTGVLDFDGHLYFGGIWPAASGVPASSSLRDAIWADLGTRFGL